VARGEAPERSSRRPHRAPPRGIGPEALGGAAPARPGDAAPDPPVASRGGRLAARLSGRRVGESVPRGVPPSGPPTMSGRPRAPQSPGEGGHRRGRRHREGPLGRRPDDGTRAERTGSWKPP